MKTVSKIFVLLVLLALVGCKSTEEKLAEKLVACDGAACNEIMKELVQLPLEKQLTVNQLMMLDTNYQKKMKRKAAVEKMDLISVNAEWYIKMQSAGFEATDKIMDFRRIGFTYDSGNEFLIMEGEDFSFEASSLVELDECPADSKWIVMPVVTGKDLTYTCSIVSQNEKACAEISEKFLSLCK